jgi:tetratricopeptide (TPR) repeat protein
MLSIEKMGRRCVPPAVIAGLIAAFWLSMLPAQIPAARVEGTIKDMDGRPLKDVEVEFTPMGKAAKPFVVKSRKDGAFLFPFLPYNKEMYTVAFKKEGFKVRKIKIVSRQPLGPNDLKGMLIQDDQGTIGIEQKIPLVNAKPGGKVVMEIGMVTDGFFEQMAAQKAAQRAAAEGGGQPAPPPPESLPPADPLLAARQLSSQGQHEEADTLLSEAVAEEPSAERWHELGRIRDRAGNSAGAKAALSRAAGLEPDRQGVHLLLAKIYNDEGRIDQAVEEAEKERAVAPDDSRTLRVLASLYSQAGRTDDAIAAYEELTSQPDADPAMLSRLASLYGKKGDYAKSEEVYRRVVEADPENADATYFKIGLSIINQANLGQEERESAAAAFQKAIEANPSHDQAHLELAYVLLGLGKIPEAKTHLKKFLEISPKDPKAPEVRAQLKDLG